MDERKEQIARLKKEAIYEMLHYHERSAGQRGKELLKKLAGRYVPPVDLISWPTGLLANTLAEHYELWEEKEEVLNALREYFDRWIGAGMPICYIDDVLCGVALLDLYRLTGELKYKEGADKMARFLYDIKKVDGAGSIPYRPGQDNRYVFVDGIGMMCPFLCRYGAETGQPKAVELAVRQAGNMLRYGMDSTTGLPYHGYEYESGLKYGMIGWGRAVGWLLMGLKETALHNREAGDGKMEGAFSDIVTNVLAYQKEDGAFSWQLEALEGPSDSSATAMIAAAVSGGLENGLISGGSLCERCRKAVGKAARYLSLCEKQGKIYFSSGECMGFSQYPQIYGSYPWSLGPGLEVLVKGW